MDTASVVNYSSAQQPTISIRELSIRYGENTALHNVSMDIFPGSITAIIGPSGCGKSSLLQAINRINDLIPGCRTQGEIYVGGEDIRSIRQHELSRLRKRVGMIFQKPNPFPLSIRKNIHLPLREHGVKQKLERNKMTQQVLAEVGLWDEVKDRLDDSALNLSGGQQQRLCIARALALEPEILLFDEPCSALDPVASRKVEELIVRLKQRASILIVTHNMAQARRIADRVAMFWYVDRSGQLIEMGDKCQIFDTPQNPLTRDYVLGDRG